MKEKITPLPWRISNELSDTRIVNTDGYGTTLGLICRFPLVKDWPNSDENAAYIVKCVNNFEKLVNALIAVIHYADRIDYRSPIADSDEIRHARAVLAEIEKGE